MKQGIDVIALARTPAKLVLRDDLQQEVKQHLRVVRGASSGRWACLLAVKALAACSVGVVLTNL